MKTALIITHPGSAHFDEVTAIGLILAEHGDTEFRIERRAPTDAELDDTSVWVVDTGNRHQPERLNFDHHQHRDCAAAFVLVARHLGLEETLSVAPWWHFKDEVDRYGPVNSSLKFGAGDALINHNPVETWLTANFAAAPQAVVPQLASLGADIIAGARTLKAQIDFWRTARRLTIHGVPAMIGETRESAGLEEFRRLTADPPDIVISLDRRDDGWRLFRYDGTAVDFSRIAQRPEVAFAHQTGFMAKTHQRLGMDELVALVGLAVTAANPPPQAPA